MCRWCDRCSYQPAWIYEDTEYEFEDTVNTRRDVRRCPTTTKRPHVEYPRKGRYRAMIVNDNHRQPWSAKMEHKQTNIPDKQHTEYGNLDHVHLNQLMKMPKIQQMVQAYRADKEVEIEPTEIVLKSFSHGTQMLRVSIRRRLPRNKSVHVDREMTFLPIGDEFIPFGGDEKPKTKKPSGYLYLERLDRLKDRTVGMPCVMVLPQGKKGWKRFKGRQTQERIGAYCRYRWEPKSFKKNNKNRRPSALEDDANLDAPLELQPSIEDEQKIKEKIEDEEKDKPIFLYAVWGQLNKRFLLEKAILRDALPNDGKNPLIEPNYRRLLEWYLNEYFPANRGTGYRSRVHWEGQTDSYIRLSSDDDVDLHIAMDNVMAFPAKPFSGLTGKVVELRPIPSLPVRIRELREEVLDWLDEYGNGS